jgi:Peptidase A4 family
MDQSASIRDGSPGGPGRRVRRPGWRTIVRWGRWPVIACLLASLGAGIASADTGVGQTAPVASVATGRGLIVPVTTCTISNCSTWSGYVAEGGSYQAVNAIFTVPAGFCTQGPSESGPDTAYWVGLEGPADGAAAIAQAGFSLICINGQPTYYAWTANGNGKANPPLTEPVEPGDQVAVSIFCPGSGTCTQQLQDVTQNWDQTFSLPMPAGFSTGTMAAVAAESFHGGINSTPVQVTDANVDITPIGQVGAEAMEENPSMYGGTAALVPSPLDPNGMNFMFAYNNSTGS